MSIDAEIDRVVAAFLEDLAELVHRTAVEAVNEAFGSMEAAAPVRARPAKVKPKAAPARLGKPVEAAPPPEPRVTRVEPVILPPVTMGNPKGVPQTPPVRRKLDRQRRGRLVVLPPTHATTAPRAAKPEAPAAPAKPAPPPEPIPAKAWVVVRRPAKNAPPAAEAAAPSPTNGEAPRPQPEAPATNGAAPTPAAEGI